MKYVIYLLTIALLISCSYSGREENSQDTSVNFKTLDTLIPFSGYWLSEKYYTDIIKHKSPREAQDNSEFIYIPDRTKFTTMMIYNFHEGGASLTVLKNKNNFELWETHNDSLIRLSKTIAILTENKIKIGDTYFVKINCENNNKILEEILFKGKYTNDKSEVIEFRNNGGVVGLGRFKYYNPIMDYYDEGMNVNLIDLGKTEKDQERFGFKFKTDTLEIYLLKCVAFDSTSHNCGIVELGKLEYKLWKKE